MLNENMQKFVGKLFRCKCGGNTCNMPFMALKIKKNEYNNELVIDFYYFKKKIITKDSFLIENVEWIT